MLCEYFANKMIWIHISGRHRSVLYLRVHHQIFGCMQDPQSREFYCCGQQPPARDPTLSMIEDEQGDESLGSLNILLQEMICTNPVPFCREVDGDNLNIYTVHGDGDAAADSLGENDLENPAAPEEEEDEGENMEEETFLLTEAFECMDIDGGGSLDEEEMSIFMSLLGQKDGKKHQLLRGRSRTPQPGFETSVEVTKEEFISRCVLPSLRLRCPAPCPAPMESIR